MQQKCLLSAMTTTATLRLKQFIRKRLSVAFYSHIQRLSTNFLLKNVRMYVQGRGILRICMEQLLERT